MNIEKLNNDYQKALKSLRGDGQNLRKGAMKRISEVSKLSEPTCKNIIREIKVRHAPGTILLVKEATIKVAREFELIDL